MGRFAPKYSKEQRAAVVKAIIDDDTWPSTVVELAAKGELEGLAPFDLNISSARDMAGKERRRRRGINLGPLARGELREAGDQLLRRLVDLQTQDVERLEMGNRYGRFSRSAFRDAARNQRELDAMLRPRERAAKGSPEAAPKPDGLLERLASKDKRAKADMEVTKRAKGGGAPRTKAKAAKDADSADLTEAQNPRSRNGSDSEQHLDAAPDSAPTHTSDGESAAPSDGAEQHTESRGEQQGDRGTGPVPMPTSDPSKHDQGSGI